MQVKGKKLTALLLAAACLSAALCGCGADDVPISEAIRGGIVSEALSSALSTAVSPKPAAPSDGIHADVDYADMTWYVYDTGEFFEKAERLSETADDDEAVELYEWLKAEYAKVYTLDPIVTGELDKDAYETKMRENLATLLEALGE